MKAFAFTLCLLFGLVGCSRSGDRTEIESLKKSHHELKAQVAALQKTIDGMKTEVTTEKLVAKTVHVETALGSIRITGGVGITILGPEKDKGRYAALDEYHLAIGDSENYNATSDSDLGTGIRISSFNNREPEVAIFRRSLDEKSNANTEFLHHLSEKEDARPSVYLGTPKNGDSFSAIRHNFGALLVTMGAAEKFGTGSRATLKICNAAGVALSGLRAKVKYTAYRSPDTGKKTRETLNTDIIIAEKIPPAVWISREVVFDCPSDEVRDVIISKFEVQGIFTPK